MSCCKSQLRSVLAPSRKMNHWQHKSFVTRVGGSAQAEEKLEVICVLFFCSVYEGFTKKKSGGRGASKKSLLFSSGSDSSSDIIYEINHLLLPLCSPPLPFLGGNWNWLPWKQWPWGTVCTQVAPGRLETSNKLLFFFSIVGESGMDTAERGRIKHPASAGNPPRSREAEAGGEGSQESHLAGFFFFPEGEAMSDPPAALQTVWHRGQGQGGNPLERSRPSRATDGVGADQPVCTWCCVCLWKRRRVLQLEVSALTDSSKPTILQQTGGI